MNIDVTIKNEAAQVELIKAMAAKDPSVAMAAREAFAKILSIQIGSFYQQADTTKAFFKDMVYQGDDVPDVPLALYSSVTKGHFTVTSSAMPGAIPTNHVYEAPQYARFAPYRYDSAISFNEKYARKANLDVVSAAIQRLVQEVLLKTNDAAWNVMLYALANARYTARSGANATVSIGQVFESTTDEVFSLEDLNKLFTSFKRINSSWNQGTPVNGSGRPTDIYLSPELMEQIRGMAYQPVNTVGANRTSVSAGTDGGAGGGVTLPDAQRQAIFNAAGSPSFFGVSFNELNELGVGQDYEALFTSYIGSTQLPKVGTAAGSGTFDSTDDELLIIMDNSKAGGVRAIASDSDTGSVFSLENDDQFVKRQKTIGLFGGVEEARLWLETRSIAALVV